MCLLWQEKFASCTKATPQFCIDHTAIRPISKADAIKVVVQDLVQNLVGKIGELHCCIAFVSF